MWLQNQDDRNFQFRNTAFEIIDSYKFSDFVVHQSEMYFSFYNNGRNIRLDVRSNGSALSKK